ncbi:MAG: response regulator [Candidatus Omnitrophica bacterium]|nr:response regulator [Candidatus Omnitrophota bacterium]
MAKKILIVDDELDILEVLTFRLSKEGYSVVTAASGQEALEQLEKEVPSLILLDIRMPDINGYEICKRVKTGKKWKHIPIIMLTASSMLKVEKAVEKYKVEGFLIKPFDYEKLLEKIKEFIS